MSSNQSSGRRQRFCLADRGKQVIRAGPSVSDHTDEMERAGWLGERSQSRHAPNQTSSAGAGDPDLLSIPETARMLNMSAEHCYRLARRGDLPGAVRIGSRWLVSRPRLSAHLHGPSLDGPRES
jgi:excisionase family DNA binding protein